MLSSLVPKALRITDLRRFLGGQLTSLLGDAMVSVAMVFAILDLTGSPTALGVVAAARTLAVLTTMLAGGVVADRFSRRRVMLISDVARGGVQAAVAVLLLTGHAHVWELAVLQAGYGCATAMFVPAVTGLLPEIAGEHLQQANALRGQADSIAFLIGPALAGVLVTVASPGWVFTVDALSFAVSVAQLSRLRPIAPAPPRTASVLRDFGEGWTEFRSRPWLLTYVGTAALNNMLFPVFMILGPVVLGRGRYGPLVWSVLLVAGGVGALLGGSLAARISPQYPARMASALMVLFPLPLLGLAAHLPVPALIVVTVVADAAITVSNILWITLQQRHIDAAVLSRTNSFLEFGCLAARPIGQSATGPIAAAAGVGPTLWVAGVVQCGVAAVALALPTTRDLPAEPRDRVDAT
ncbi:MFS transporter [Nocardia stercoris]|uniref:MFS transporter n=1 Tax=Nocardia stercoris TaxID=2483361 RepID=A0A3M2L2P1_9NOCA|nr:MFS transporter [Nocardia stercoris]RMI30095.1 MFS transporter [Nocardia stercoris]